MHGIVEKYIIKLFIVVYICWQGGSQMLYWIDTKYACFGLIVDHNVIVDAPPIAKWTIGKDINYVINYYKYKKKGKAIKIN